MATASIDVTVDFADAAFAGDDCNDLFDICFLFGSASRLSGLRSEQLSPQLEQLPLHPLIKNTPFCVVCCYSTTKAGKVKRPHGGSG